MDSSQEIHWYLKGSLRSKRFQSSYCAKVIAEAKNKKLSSQLSRRTRAETFATQATSMAHLRSVTLKMLFYKFLDFNAKMLTLKEKINNLKG